jgi:hypothetical protein
MSIVEKVARNLQVLPESAQIEVLDFVEFLTSKAEIREDADWSEFSLGEAVRGLEDEPIQYSEQDLKEVFT